MIWCVYIDQTDDGRPFYVGKGTPKRVRCTHRNLVHQRMAKKYGFHREVVLITSVENIALDFERELIAKLKTRCDIPENWGANMTEGGAGVVNSSPEVRKRMSEAQRRRAREGRMSRPSFQVKQRIREVMILRHAAGLGGMLGHKHSSETIEKMRKVHTGRHLSDEAKAKVGAASRARWQTPEFRERHHQAMRGKSN